MKAVEGRQLVRGPVNGPNVGSWGAGRRSGAQREGASEGGEVNWRGNCDFPAPGSSLKALC